VGEKAESAALLLPLPEEQHPSRALRAERLQHPRKEEEENEEELKAA
jgi:hypothetical protein